MRCLALGNLAVDQLETCSQFRDVNEEYGGTQAETGDVEFLFSNNTQPSVQHTQHR